MEVIFGIIAVIFGYWLFFKVLGAGISSVKAVAKTAFGNGTLAENFELEFKGMGALECRINEKNLGEDGKQFHALEIEVKGLFPISSSLNLAFVTSVLEKSGDEYLSVLSVNDKFQESKTRAYQVKHIFGVVKPNQGFIKWVRVGIVIPEILQFAYKGKKNLKIIVRLINENVPPEITLGFGPLGGVGIIWTRELSYEYVCKETGYKEEVAHAEEAQELAVKIAVGVATIKGGITDKKGQAIKEWMGNVVARYKDEYKEETKRRLNMALKEAYDLSKDNQLELSSFVVRLSDIGSRPQKHDAYELVYKLATSDGAINKEVLNKVQAISEALELDVNEINKIRDHHVVQLAGQVNDQETIEAILGIDPTWDKQRIKTHLSSEFIKWSNRLNALSEGEEQNNAQLMLNYIGEARKKYVG